MTNSSLNKKYLVEELEILFAKEVLLYNDKVCLEWETILYDPLHYEELLGGTIYWQYTQLIYDRIEHLNKFEATRFFALSIAQFESHTPDSRLNEYSKEYCKAKCVLLNKESSISSLDLTNIKQSWHFYERYFPAYKIATENAFEDYKSGV